MTETLYKTRWRLGTIDGGRDTTDLDLAVTDVRYALERGYEHVEVEAKQLVEDLTTKEN